MTRLLSRLSSVAVLAGCAGAPPQHADTNVPIASLSRVWRVSTQFGHGTAFPVRSEPNEYGKWSTLFLTAGHMDDDGGGYSVEHPDGRHIEDGVTVDTHPFLDARILVFLGDAAVDVLSLSLEDLVAGERVYSNGAQGPQPFFGPPRLWITSGIAVSRDRTSIESYPGGSGSPVMRSDGTVAGIAVWLGGAVNRWTGATEWIMHHNYCVPMNDLRDFLMLYDIY